jgi:ribulose-5-phosphate 4-epimerase/fuculose-1-phosphate aldolase
MMIGNNVRDDLARVCRILAHHQMVDLWGHLSLRIPKSALVLTTPRFSKHCLPRGITERDLLVCDTAGNLVEGSADLPVQFEADLAIYRENPEREACIFASPRVAMAAAIAGYVLKPLTHMESATGYGVETWDTSTLVDTGARGDELARRAANATALHQPGIGVWAAGSDIFDSLTTLYHLEYLAQVNLVMANEGSMRIIAREDSDKLWRQFSGHHHYQEFFTSLDPGPQRHPYEGFRASCNGVGQALNELKAAMAFSCRVLWARDTLVGFLEHISHRISGRDRFLMTASKNFRDMEPGDVCLLDSNANWIDGPRPPGFKWFHAQLLRERLDAQAVVHTHDVYGRAYALSSRELVPSYRVGLDIATSRLPIFGRCDLIVDPEVRRATLDALGTGPVVHEAGHGTDFVAATLERATVDAIQREAFLAMDHLARQFGTPRPMAAGLVTQLGVHEPSAEDWWWFYASEVGAPRRSVAGL